MAASDLNKVSNNAKNISAKEIIHDINKTSGSTFIDNKDSTNNASESLFEYDELKMYFGEPYWVTDKICITCPTIGDIIEFGDIKFYSIISTLCANTTSFRLKLWDMGIDWTKISDYELFIWLRKGFTAKDTSLILGDLNLSWFEPFVKQDKNEDEKEVILIYIPRDENGEPVKVDLYNSDDLIIIDELVYLKIVDYLRKMFDIHPKVERNIKGKTTKQWIIDEERINLANEEKLNKGKPKKNKSFLYPLISAMVNHPGFKYKKNELKEICITEFMDSVKRLQTYESVRALMSGMYSGMLDTKKLDMNKELNWMRDLY